MPEDLKIVISASRRTDIPAFYMPWFEERIEKGFFEVKNPYNGKVSVVPATPDRVHTIVFWSKNFGHFIEKDYGKKLTRAGYHLFFNFTVNSDNRILEPGVPGLDERLGQAEAIAEAFGPEAVQWRFDPVCYYVDASGKVRNNLGDFRKIADFMRSIGVKRCVTSFLDIYAKVKTRAGKNGLMFSDPPVDKKIRILQRMSDVLSENGMALFTCCEKEIFELLPPESGVMQSACVPNRYLTELYGGKLSYRKDYGQRVKHGCGCMTSADIGSYSEQPCYHDCLFCYANPRKRPAFLKGAGL